MDLGLAGRVCAVTGASRGIGRATARMLAAEGAVGAARRPAEPRASPRPRRSAAARRATAPASRPWRSTSPSPMPASGSWPSASERFGQPRRARQQRRHRARAPARRHPRGGLVRRLGAQRDGADAAHARGAPGDGRARLGPGRQRRPRPPASGRRRGCPSTRSPRPRSSRSRACSPTATRATACSSTRSARARRSRSCGWPRAACSTSRRSTPATTHASRRSPRPPAGGRSGGWPRVDEIAAAIVFLCSERASYVAGSAWSVDGGTVQVII